MRSICSFAYLGWCCLVAITTARPVTQSCIDGDVIDLLGLSLAQFSNFPNGVEIVKENGVKAYRFEPEARLLGFPASEVMTSCSYFPQEFSLVITFLREIVKNGNEYVLSVLAQDHHTVLMAVKVQRDKMSLEFAGVAGGEKVTSSYQSNRFADGQWHTVIITVTKKEVKFTLDCLQPVVKELQHAFPRKLNTMKSRFYIGSRRRKRNRYLGLVRQIKLIPGADAEIHLCSKSDSKFTSWLGVDIFTTKKQEKNVIIDDFTASSEKLTCSDVTKDQLLYNKNDGNLEICKRNTWTKLGTLIERLDYVVEFEELITKSKTLDIEVFRIPEEGLFLAAANQGRDRSMDSTIYKWNNTQNRFISYQNISTDTARNWEYFTIGSEHFLAVANQGSDERSATAQSAIYRWSYNRNKFILHQLIPTFSARSWESFKIDGKHFLAVTNYAGVNGHQETSWIYSWDAEHRAFMKYQAIETIGAYDFEYFQADDNHFLAVANSFNGVKTNLDSVIYQWRQSNFVPLQYVETFGATDWEHFVISGRHFLAVANYYDIDPERNTYLVDSLIFEFKPKINQFVKIQSLQTHGALDFEFFTIGRDSYLIAASSSDGKEKLTNIIYRWQGMEHFVPVHSITTYPCADWEEFTTDDGNHYLISANAKSRKSKILQLLTY